MKKERRKELRQSRLSFEYEVEQDDGAVTSYGGLPLAIDVLRSQGADRSIREHLHVRQRECDHDDLAMVEAMVLLFAAGGDCFDDLQMLASDKGLCRLLERELPSPETARNYCYAFHDEALVAQAAAALAPGESAYIPAENAHLAALGRVMNDFVHAVAGRHQEVTTATVDADSTIVESHKREAKFHYDDGRGYQPMVAAWAELDLIIADQFRDGNVPSAKGVLDFVQKAFAAVPATMKRRRFRGDSAFYNWDLMKWLYRERIGFTVSAKVSDELKQACLRVPPQEWRLLESRAHEDVFVAKVSHVPVDWPKDLPTVRFIGVRFDPKQRDLFDERQTKYLAVATDLTLPIEELVYWHWEKAGTIERVHDVMKNDLGAGVLPCGRFGANAAWWRLNALTYNVLSAMKSIALPSALKNARPKRLRFQVFTIPATIASHARQLWARVKDRAGCATANLVLARRTLWRAAPA